MSSFHEPSPQATPDLPPREQVLRIGNELIDLVHRDGAFTFDNGWAARPLGMLPDEPFEGAVFERNKLRYDALDRFELTRLGEAAVGIKWTSVRPNANTRTTKVIDSYIGSDMDIHRASSRWSDVVPPNFDDKSIDELKGALTDLQIRTLLPAPSPRPGWLKRLFGRAPSN